MSNAKSKSQNAGVHACVYGAILISLPAMYNDSLFLAPLLSRQESRVLLSSVAEMLGKVNVEI